MDNDTLLAAVHVADWLPGRADDVNAQAAELQNSVAMACDIAVPRARKKPARSMYWWSDRLTALRDRANRARRQYTRATNRKNATLEEVTTLHREYSRADKSLRRAIKRSRASNELLETLHRDPWCRLYRAVLDRMRGWTSPLTESIEPAFARRLFVALFPISLGGRGRRWRFLRRGTISDGPTTSG